MKIFFLHAMVVLEIKTEYNGLQITDPYFIHNKTENKSKV